MYAWNTLGAIVGAAIAGFFLVPLLKYEGAVRVMVMLNLALAVAAATMLPTTRRWPLALSAALLGFVVIAYFPSAPERILRFSPMLPTATGDMIYYDVGRTATVLVFEQDGEFHFRSNGLPEATAAPL